MKNSNHTTIKEPSNAELLEQLKAVGFEFETPEPKAEEVVEPMEETTPTSENPFVFSFDMMDKKEEGEVEGETFELNKLQEAMKKVLRDNSKEMARARFFINGEDENGLPYGNFNGAGKRAITMYQPEHPDAGTGRNYGKVFYRWSNPKVVALMDAIFMECGWDKTLLEE